MATEGNSLIFTIVNKGFSEEAMAAARAAGAKGGTIINARGTGDFEIAKFLGIVIEPEKEMILIITENQKRNEIMSEMYKAIGLMSNAGGFSFSVPVENILGNSFLSFLDKEAEQKPE